MNFDLAKPVANVAASKVRILDPLRSRDSP
jgi:hypothetical protein